MAWVTGPPHSREADHHHCVRDSGSGTKCKVQCGGAVHPAHLCDVLYSTSTCPSPSSALSNHSGLVPGVLLNPLWNPSFPHLAVLLNLKYLQPYPWLPAWVSPSKHPSPLYLLPGLHPSLSPQGAFLQPQPPSLTNPSPHYPGWTSHCPGSPHCSPSVGTAILLKAFPVPTFFPPPHVSHIPSLAP